MDAFTLVALIPTALPTDRPIRIMYHNRKVKKSEVELARQKLPYRLRF